MSVSFNISFLLYCSKLSHTGWLKKTEIYCTIGYKFWRLESPKSACYEDHVASEVSMGSSFLAYFRFW